MVRRERIGGAAAVSGTVRDGKDLSVVEPFELSLWNAWDDQTIFQRNCPRECAAEVSEGRAVNYTQRVPRAVDPLRWFGAWGPWMIRVGSGSSWGRGEPGQARAVMEDAARDSVRTMVVWRRSVPFGWSRQEREIRMVLGYSENEAVRKWEADEGPIWKRPARAGPGRRPRLRGRAPARLRENWTLLDRVRVESLSRAGTTVNKEPRQCAVSIIRRSACIRERHSKGIGSGTLPRTFWDLQCCPTGSIPVWP